jgi:hypothetical protein
MLILAKKKDYYDGVAGTTGIDKTIVYDRQIIEYDDKKLLIPVLFQKNIRNKNNKNIFNDLDYHHLNKDIQKKYPHYNYFIIGFCGKLYIGWKLYHEGIPYHDEFGFKKIPFMTDITYNFDYMKTIIDSNFWKRKGNFENNILYIRNYDAIELFRELKTPIFVYDNDYCRNSMKKYWHNNNYKFIVNPLLRNYVFYKIFNSFQAFQEIQMFLGGVLGVGEKEIIEVADKYKIQQHGFDYKWSFRKESTKKI